MEIALLDLRLADELQVARFLAAPFRLIVQDGRRARLRQQEHHQHVEWAGDHEQLPGREAPAQSLDGVRGEYGSRCWPRSRSHGPQRDRVAEGCGRPDVAEGGAYDAQAGPAHEA